MVSRCGGFCELVGFASRRVRLRRTALRAAPLFLLEL